MTSVAVRQGTNYRRIASAPKITMSSGDETWYYGVYIPKDVDLNCLDDVIVEPSYADKVEALKILKKIKSARMKRFKSEEEAESFARGECQDNFEKENNPLLTASVESLPFKSLRTQDLVQLRLAIEKGEVIKAKKLIESNPRYLIASGDTPSILQPRFRYNALHAAACKGQTTCAELILNQLSDGEFMRKLYPTDDENMRRERILFLTDLYLNTPEKGCNETPLHFASKFGHASLVALLLNEPLIHKSARNKDGKTALDIVCSRSGTSSAAKLIKEMFEGQCYIPLYRSEMDDAVPIVGDIWCLNSDDPFSPVQSKAASNSPLTCSPLRARNQNKLPLIKSPVAESRSPRADFTDTMVVKALAGPMSPQQASEFKRNWSSPHKLRRLYGSGDSPLRPSIGSPSGLSKDSADLAKQDPYKGLESIGRGLAHDMSIPWNEYWDFLDCAVDVRSDSGLEKIEKYLLEKESEINVSTKLEPRVQGRCDVFMESTNHPDNLDSSHHDNILHDSSHHESSRHDSNGPTGDVLNTTDDTIARMMERLTIHSPSSPAYRQDKPRLHETAMMGQPDASVVFSRGDGGEKVSRSYKKLSADILAPRTELEKKREPVESSLNLDTSDLEPTGELDVEKVETIRPVVFLKGERPCKTDNDVSSALELVDIDQNKYPAVLNWLRNVNSYSRKEKQSWASPMVMRHRARLTAVPRKLNL